MEPAAGDDPPFEDTPPEDLAPAWPGWPPPRQLKAACEWLVAEARRLGTDHDATELTGHVLDLVAQLRATTAGRLAASRQAHRDAAKAAMQKGPGP